MTATAGRTSQPEFVDLYRAGLRSSVELMKASLEGMERLQNQQLAAVRAAVEQQSKSSGDLGKAKTLDELIDLQGRLAGAQFERLMGYWSGLYQAAGQNQMALLAQARAWLSEVPKK
jgi:phasin family protein